MSRCLDRWSVKLARLMTAMAACWISALATAAPIQPFHPRAEAHEAPKPSVIQVGPSRAIKTLSEAAKRAQRGDVIEVDAGRYLGDTAVWTQSHLTLRAVGGRVTLVANGQAAEGKGIWVVRAADMVVEGFDFEGAAVPSRNGAGIRLESGSLRVRDCKFLGNEMGLLTNNDPGEVPTTVLEIENCEFAYNARPDGHNHQLYVGRIARLSVRGSYFHHGKVGHLLKSRAAFNRIEYNRLTDEPGGSASYELEFPDGGVAVVIGNLIAQSASTRNPHLIAFGAEGLRGPRHELYLVNNTLVDHLPGGGVFLRTAPGIQVLKAVNNLMVGNKAPLAAQQDGLVFNNYSVGLDEFVQADAGDYRLRPRSALRGRAQDPGFTASGPSGERVDLTSRHEYVHPYSVSTPAVAATSPGAFNRCLDC